MDMETMKQKARDAASKLRAKWGTGWDLLDNRQKSGMIAAVVLDVLILHSPGGASYTPGEIDLVRMAAGLEVV